jgi:hypothetical protein
MPIYRYKAVNAAGDVATGELDAANESEIVERLRDQGMLPMQVARATGPAAGPDSVRAGAPPRRGWFAATSVNAINCWRSPGSSRRCSTPACRSTARSRS